MIRILLLTACLAACDTPPCLDENQPARLERVDADALAKQDWTAITLVMKDGTKRVCVVHPYYAKALVVGDVVRGPLQDQQSRKVQ